MAISASKAVCKALRPIVALPAPTGVLLVALRIPDLEVRAVTHDQDLAGQAQILDERSRHQHPALLVGVYRAKVGEDRPLKPAVLGVVELVEALDVALLEALPAFPGVDPHGPLFSGHPGQDGKLFEVATVLCRQGDPPLVVNGVFKCSS